jgi:hypothetical protein
MAVSVKSEPSSLSTRRSSPFTLTVTVTGAKPGRVSISVATTDSCTFDDESRKVHRSRVVGGTTATFTLNLSIECDCADDTLNTRLNVEGWDETGDRASDSTRVRYEC